MSLLGFASGLIALGILLVVGVRHALHPRSTIGLMVQQRLLPPRSTAAAFVLLTVTEIAIGGGGAAAVALDGSRSTWVVVTLAAGLLYVLLGLYSAALARWRPHAPCACSTTHLPASRWTVARSFAFAGLAATGLVVGSPEVVESYPMSQLTLVGVMCVTFGLLIWNLPNVMEHALTAQGLQ